MAKPVRLTLPTTSVVPAEVAAAGMVRVDKPVVRSPLLRVRVPFTVRSAPSEMPLARIIIKSFRPLLTAGRVVLAPDPLKAMFEVLPPVSVPPPLPIAALSISVFVPIESAPLVSDNVPLTVGLEFKVTPPELLIVRPFNTLLRLGSSGPVIILISGVVCVYWTLTVVPNAGELASEPLLREISVPLPIVKLLPLLKSP